MTGRVSMTLPQYRRHECTIDGVPKHLTTAQAELLAALLVRGPDRPLPVSEIFGLLWPDPDREPDTAHKVIQVYVSCLREIGALIIGRNGFGYTIPRDGRALNLFTVHTQRLAA